MSDPERGGRVVVVLVEIVCVVVASVGVAARVYEFTYLGE